MSDKPTRWLHDELAHELKETAATLTRLGVTLAGLPVALLPREQRQRAQQLADELARLGEIIPRTVGALLEQGSDDAQPGHPAREDLGSRLRRQQREAEALAPQSGPTDPEGDEGDDSDAPEVEEVEEDIQEAWETAPANQGS